MNTTFSQFALSQALSDGLAQANLIVPTPVQQESLPLSLQGRDILGQAATGSGKTVAFALPMLQQIELTTLDVQGVVLCPTRELADQVAEQIILLGRFMPNLKVVTLCGGRAMGPQIKSLQFGAHIVVGTPGRVLEHVSKRRLSLGTVKCRVLDEADRMLDLGFFDDVEAILRGTPAASQSLLFSATFDERLEQLAQHFLNEPASIKVVSEDSRPDITQIAYSVLDHGREQALKAVLTHHQPKRAIIFCHTKIETDIVASELQEAGFSAAPMHGDLTQQQRDDVLARMASDALSYVVATDVAARGLDLPEVDAVINYHVSDNSDTHVHRIGRTGRAGNTGLAISLVSDNEQVLLAAIEAKHDVSIPIKGIQSLRFHANRIVLPEYSCFVLQAGKKQKLRPLDILGALTQDGEVPGDDVGKIKVRNTVSYVAVKVRSVKRAARFFREGKIKGKRVRARKLG